MKRIFVVIVLFCVGGIAGCGTLESATSQINVGDSKERVSELMGAPRDRQFKGEVEAWQYCRTGAGIGYMDHRIVWFWQGKVTGVTSYKSTTPGVSCVSNIRPLDWSEDPS
jgi:hypothetical protein